MSFSRSVSLPASSLSAPGSLSGLWIRLFSRRFSFSLNRIAVKMME